MLPPGRARLATTPTPTGSLIPTNTIGTVRVACCSATRRAAAQDNVRRERDQLRRVAAIAAGIARAPAIVEAHVASVGPAQFLQPLQERSDAGQRFRIVGGEVHEHADPSHRARLLRPRRERPRRRAAEQRDELAPSHSITSSARASSVGGTVRRSMRAVSALMTSSNFDVCTTGKSDGFAPFKMRPT